MRPQRLGEIKFKHDYRPVRSRLIRASHSEISSEISANTIEMIHNLAAALSPPGVWIRVYIAEGMVRVSPEYWKQR